MATHMVDKRKRILEGDVVQVGSGACVLVPKEWLGKVARVEIIEDEEHGE